MSGDAAEMAVGDTERASTSPGMLRRVLLLGTPLALGIALWLHPGGGPDIYESLVPVSGTWLGLHLLLLPLFGLLGVCLYVLLDEFDGRLATIGRVGVGTYLVFYVAFEAIAGIATGLLVWEAQSLPPEQQAGVAAALAAIFEPTIVLALIGTAGAVVATTAVAVLLRRSGAPPFPVAFLAGVPVAVFAHGGAKVDVLGMALFLVGIVWLEYGWERSDGRQVSTAA